jgi:holin-like protein
MTQLNAARLPERSGGSRSRTMLDLREASGDCDLGCHGEGFRYRNAVAYLPGGLAHGSSTLRDDGAERNRWAETLQPATEAVGRFCYQLALVAAQLLGLWSLNAAGVWAVATAGLPVPGNLIGMLVLFALLASGIVKLSWFETSGSFLIKHLAFFFVPITVGLMDMGPLLAASGVGIIVTLALSAALGLSLAGWISQLLLCDTKERGGRS